MVTRPPSWFCDRESMVPRCSMIPVNIGTENSISTGKFDSRRAMRWTARNGCPTSFAIHVLEISLDGHIGPELLDAQVWQRRLAGSGHVRERHADLAGKFRGVEERKFMDHASGKSGAVQRRPCFEQHAQNFSLAELSEHGV